MTARWELRQVNAWIRPPMVWRVSGPGRVQTMTQHVWQRNGDNPQSAGDDPPVSGRPGEVENGYQLEGVDRQNAFPALTVPIGPCHEPRLP